MTAQSQIGTSFAKRQADSATALDRLLAIAGFLVVMGVFRTILVGSGTDRTDGSASFQIVSGGIYLAAATSLLVRGIPSSTFRILLRSWPLLLLTLLALVSTLWSQAPDATLRRAIALILTSSFAVFLVAKFDLRSVLNLLAIAFAIFCAGSVLAALVPGFGITSGGTYGGALRGLSGHKNVFGRTVAIGVAILPAAVLFGLVGRRKAVMALALFLLFLLPLSKSATSLLAAFGSVAIGALFYLALGGRLGRARLGLELGIPLLAVTIFGSVLVLSQSWTLLLEALGRDPTLTGRVKLWEWAIRLNESRHVLGSGYKAFWIDANTLYFSDFFYWSVDSDGNKSVTFGPDHSHSGYIDIFLELGWVGILCLATLIISSIVRIRQCLARGFYGIGCLFAIMLSFLLIYAVAEKSILQQSEDLWLIFMTFYLFAAKECLKSPDARLVTSSGRELVARGAWGNRSARTSWPMRGPLLRARR